MKSLILLSHLVVFFFLFWFSPTVKEGRSIASGGSDFYDDVVKIYPGTQPCAENYSKVKDCYNQNLPPAPSLMRSLINSNEQYDKQAALSSYKEEEDGSTSYFPAGNGASGKYQILPHARSSNDARLILSEGNSGPQLAIFRPGMIDVDKKITGNSPMGNQFALHPLSYFNPRDTRLDHSIYGNWGRPTSYHYNLCDAQGSGSDKANPRLCRARLSSTNSYISGDCYDVTIMVGGQQNINKGYGNFERWELRSNDITVFVPNGKDRANFDIWVYPRFAGFTLPNYNLYKDWAGSGPNFNQVTNQCYGATPPKWCDFVLSQKKASKYIVDNNGNNREDAGEFWTGDHCDSRRLPGCQSKFFFEISTTDDGLLMVINMAGLGIYYSYNTVGPCQADGWSNFKPMSFMPVDPQIYNNYDIGRSLRKGNSWIPFRDSAGRNINPGEQFGGAYGWIDRKGKNFIYSPYLGSRDNYLANWQFESSYPDVPAQNLNPDLTAGKMISVIGSWTRGKAVVLDNAINFTDFGGKSAWMNVAGTMMPVQFTYGMSLYEGEETVIRPRSSVMSLSAENQLNYYNSLSPVMPFDVVWTLSSNNQRQSEIVFDEYHMKNAFVVAHMNSPMKTLDSKGLIFPDDGFVEQNPLADVRYGGEANFSYKSSPVIQNASTMHRFFEPTADVPPLNLRLLGGARVEPVALGGVIGKGVYFDGVNDYMDMGFKNPGRNDWFISAWFDSREEDPNKVRTLFYFPDNSWIGMNQTKIYAHNSRGSSHQTKFVDISKLGMGPNKFFHFGVKVRTNGNDRELSFYINGTLVYNHGPGILKFPIVASDSYRHGFQLKLDYLNGWSWFVVGDPGPGNNSSGYQTQRSPFKGWVDEFRIYSLGKNEIQGTEYFEEFICNLAYGSLTEVYNVDRNTPLGDLLKKGFDYGHLYDPYGNTRLSSDALSPDKFARVCEQLIFESHKAPTDLADQKDRTFCASRVHQNPSEDLDDELKERCVRRKMLGIHEKPLVADGPRPDFSGTPFCLSCHSVEANVQGFSKNALVLNPHVRFNDPRRQPMDHPRKVRGCVPNEQGFIGTATSSKRCSPSDYLMDFLFDGKEKVP